MTTTSERFRTFVGERQFDREQLSGLMSRYWEVALYGAIISIALGLRLWNLGDRAIHHDESLHMFYAWKLFKLQADPGQAVYVHVPFMHGPMKYFGEALMFRLFGDSDFTARLLFALVGSALVGLPYFLRSYLGRIGAFTAALLLAISPTLMYFSRFNRDDILIVAYTLSMVIVMWRYLREQKESYLLLVPLILMLGFTTMEMTFITTAIFLVYLEYLLATQLLDQLQASRSLSRNETGLAFAIFFATGWAIAIFWPLLDNQRKRWSLNVMPPAANFMIVLLVFALPQFSAAVQKIPLPWFDGLHHIGTPNSFDEGRSHYQMKLITTGLFLAASIYIGMLWNWRLFSIGAAIFYIPFFLLYTTFFTNGGDIWNVTSSGQFWHGEGGFWTGTWGSLDYWLSQQLVRRGNQPDYFYLMSLPVYELLPLVFATGGVLFYAFRGRTEQKIQAAATVLLVFMFSVIPKHSAGPIGHYHVHMAFIIALASVLLMQMEGFTKFLIFWTLSSLFALTVAGEKMPWLVIHIALPLALLAAKVIDDILSSLGEARADAVKARAQRQAGAPAQAPPERSPLLDQVPLLVAGAAFAIIATVIFLFAGPASGVSAIAWLLSLAAAGVVLWAARRGSWQFAGQIAAVALFGSLFVFTAHAAGVASFDQGDPNDYPREMLIYAQGSPGLSVLMDNIERYGRESGDGKNVKIVIDSSVNIWPWPWYLRDYPFYSGNAFSADFTPEPGAIVFVSNGNQAKMAPYLEDYLPGIPYTHMWWFPELYRGLETSSFLGDVFNGHTFNVWRHYYVDRDVAGASQSPDMIAYFPKSATTITRPRDIQPGGTAAAQVLPDTSVTLIGDLGADPGKFTQPNDITTDLAGNIYIADTLNRRVQKFGPDGQPIGAVGETGKGDGQFGDPKELDSNYASDGPWGVAVDAQGNVYVTDTWNHRIEKFGPDLKFIKEWGAGELFGPRDIAIDPEGNVYVVDTGNKRVRKYDPEGTLIQDYGKAGSGTGQFNEPSGIYFGPGGDIYVADYWNERIQIFDSTFKYKREIEVKSWGSPGITDRAYVVVLRDGHVLATDPANARVLVFDAEGKQQAAWRLPSATGQSRPVGIAVDVQEQFAYITDSSANHVAKVALATLLAPPAAATP